MKRFILSVICVMSFFGMQAQSYDYLTFQTSDGEQSVAALGTVITFSNGNMVVKNGQEEYTIALSNLNKFYFSDSASGIQEMEKSSEPVVVYTVSGQLIGRFSDANTAKANLPRGIYVTKGKNESNKMMVE